MTRIRLTDNAAAIDFKQVRALLADSYWVPGITLKRVRLVAANSLVVAAILRRGREGGDEVLAYGRVVSDGSRFAYLADIMVHPDHRGQGLGKRIAGYLIGHRKVKAVDLWLLMTKDAHGLYAQFGFGSLDFPDRVMMKRGLSKLDPCDPLRPKNPSPR